LLDGGAAVNLCYRASARRKKLLITEDEMAATPPMLIRETFPVGPLQCNCNHC